MTTKHSILIILLLSVLFTSCGEDAALTKRESGSVSRASFTIGIPTNLSEAFENGISSIDVYSFRKQNGENEYTFEKAYENITSQDDTHPSSVELTLDGSLERILYFVANGSGKIPFMKELTAVTTNKKFEDSAFLYESIVPQLPYILVGKQSVPAVTSADVPVSVKLGHVLACLDINNRYEGFAVDSLVVKEAVCGTSLFTPVTPGVEQVARGSVNYGNAQQVYLYQTDASVLAVYGKYNGVRAVFDIQLKDIKKATRYRVTFRSTDDSESDFAGKLQWSVAPWNNGETVESTPDWH